MKEKLLSEKGLISVYVFVTMVFAIIVLASIYSVSSSLKESQLKYNGKIKQIYEKDVEDAEAIYQNMR